MAARRSLDRSWPWREDFSSLEATERRDSAAPRLRRPTLDFDVGYLNLAGGIAPGRLADALSRKGCGTLCFYGPPGTGKTEFAHV